MNSILSIPTFLPALIFFWIAGILNWTKDYLFKPVSWSIHLPSGDFNPSWSYIILFMGFVLLMIEILKSAYINRFTFIENVLSWLTFLGFLFTFMFQSWACNSIGFFFTVLSFADVALAYGIGLFLFGEKRTHFIG